MNIFQAMQICYDIKQLYSLIYVKNDTVTLFEDYDYVQDYILKRKNQCIIQASHYNKRRSHTDFVPFTKWNCCIKRAGNYKIIPENFTVCINNNGVLPHAPIDKDYTVRGLPAKIIYQKLRKEYKLSQGKQK